MAKTPAEMVLMPVVYRLPGMETARVVSNLSYSDVDNPYLLMDEHGFDLLNDDERSREIIRGVPGFLETRLRG